MDKIKPAPERLEVEITYKIPEPVVDYVVAGACYEVIHNLLAEYLVKKFILKRNGRRTMR